MMRIVLTAVMYSFVSVLLYLCVLAPERGRTEKKKGGAATLAVMLAAGVGARLFAARLYPGFEADMECFSAWARRMYEVGAGGFYSADFFSDYPPGYMYVLWLLGAVQRVLGLGRDGFYLLLKLPAIAADIITAALLVRLAEKHTTHTAAMTLGGLYLFNPTVFINSAVWGQVDAIYTLFVFVSIWAASEKKLPRSFFSFAAAAVIKPQAAFFAPILIFAAAEECIYPEFRPKRLGALVLWALAAVGAALVLALPFGIGKVISQYIGTLASYRYCSVNAFNFWAMLGLNWHGLSGAVSAASYAAILLAVIFAGVCFFRTDGKAKYFWLGGVICVLTFTFAAKMHERYGYAAIILLAAGCAVSGRREAFSATLFFGITQFVNVAYVLFYYNAEAYAASGQSTFAAVWGIFAVAAALAVIYATLKSAGFKTLKKEKKRRTAFCVAKSAPKVPITRRDVCIMALLAAIYCVPALWDLGDMHAPQNGVSITSEERFEINAARGTGKMRLYLGPYHISESNPLTVNFYDESGGSAASYVFKNGSVFCWNEYELDVPKAASVGFSAGDRVEIFEAAFYDTDGEIAAQSPSALCDEAELVPERITFRNGTYFDEIYHARTAYEFIHGLPVYEWTHPPLGKVFISLGIRAFGMTPFGWRIVGTLFGIMMIPAIYIFAKKLFGKTAYAAFCAALLAFDFMHFAQTRIATIDVYVTFFIILMYLFMLMYSRLSFYDTGLKRTFVPLGLCGICFGLGAASKWTGLYAGGGLAVIFFAVLWRRYREYRLALNDPSGVSDGISHKYIAEKFPRYAAATVGFCVIFFVLLPLAVYALSYIPFIRANGTGLWGAVKNQWDMFNYHSNIEAEHSFASPWYTWPIMYRPIWYYSGSISDTVKEGISSFGNPLVWWTAIPAFFYTVYRAKDDKNARFLCVGYLSGLLPWIPVTRITFIYHYFPCVPFAVLMVGYAAHGLLCKKKYEGRTLLVYAVCTALLFAMFYHVLSGQPVGIWYVKHFLKWSSEWVLVSGA